MEYYGISKLDLKRKNRSQILKVIREQGSISRVDIAGILKITRAAVTIITNEMIEEGVLYEVGEAPVSRENIQKGRRKILIDINPNYKFVLGVSINDSSISIGISNLAPSVLDENSMEYSDKLSFDDIVGFIADEARKIMEKAASNAFPDDFQNNFQKKSHNESKILGMGVCIQPELCSKMKAYFKDGSIDFSSLTETLESMLKIPVTCMNSISAMALANQEKKFEERFGNYIFIKFGKNINMSILLENEVMHEYINHTGQIERIICNPGGAKLDGYPDGSVKAELSRDALIEKYAAVLSKKDTPIFWEATGGKSENINYKTITVAASKGEAKVLEVLDSILDCMALLVNNLSITVFARYIVLHCFYMNDWVFDRFKKKVADMCGEETVKKLRISRTEKLLEFKGGCAIAACEFFYNNGGSQYR